MKYLPYLFAAVLLATACDKETDGVLPAGGEGGITFRVSTRAGEDGEGSEPVSDKRQTWLYVAERPQEHTEALHCAPTPEMRHELSGNQYNLSGLYGQWYKFAFFSIPQWDGRGDLLTEEEPGSATCDFTKLMINFSPVLRHQKENINTTEDMHIYRQVIDRWIHPDEPSLEDVRMRRITGELLLQMGKPADQFEFPVDFIQLTLQGVKNKVYIRDNANAEVILGEGVNSYEDFYYTITLDDSREDQYSPQILRLTLLPGALEGSILVKYKDYDSAGNFPIGGEKGFPVTIKPNVRTIVLFNGMEKDEFEVRYAGFNDGDDAVIDLPEDEWDGWREN